MYFEFNIILCIISLLSIVSLKYLAEMKRFECWEWVVMVRSEWVGGRKCINSFEVYSGFKWDQIYYKILNVNPIIPI